MPIFEGDRALLDAFRQGERQALEKVYRTYIDDVLKLVRCGFVSGAARVQGQPTVEGQLELAQEIFARAFSERARLGYDGLRPYRPFLIRLAKNLIIDRLRTSGREISVEDLDDSVLEEPEDGRTPEERIHWQRLSEATQAYLKDQPPTLRRFIELRFMEERSQYEVLKILGITRRRVRTLEKQALSGLQAYLEEKGLGRGPK